MLLVNYALCIEIFDLNYNPETQIFNLRIFGAENEYFFHFDKHSYRKSMNFAFFGGRTMQIDA